MIQTKSIQEAYNASIFESESLKVLEEIFQKNKIAVMAGGSMLYKNAVCNGIDDLPTIDKEVRSDLVKKYEVEGIESLRLQLKKLDPN